MLHFLPPVKIAGVWAKCPSQGFKLSRELTAGTSRVDIRLVHPSPPCRDATGQEVGKRREKEEEEERGEGEENLRAH